MSKCLAKVGIYAHIATYMDDFVTIKIRDEVVKLIYCSYIYQYENDL